MLRTEEDFLFAEEMARSTRRFEDAMLVAGVELTRELGSQAQAARVRVKSLIEASAELRLDCRRIREQSAALRQEIGESRLRYRWLSGAANPVPVPGR